ncbi:MAG: hypothetical protein PHX51_05675 [Clostridia bacterium]|nr:hypothetical protein [Clostridia bacterium]
MDKKKIYKEDNIDITIQEYSDTLNALKYANAPAVDSIIEESHNNSSLMDEKKSDLYDDTLTAERFESKFDKQINDEYYSNLLKNTHLLSKRLKTSDKKHISRLLLITPPNEYVDGLAYILLDCGYKVAIMLLDSYENAASLAHIESYAADIIIDFVGIASCVTDYARKIIAVVPSRYGLFEQIEVNATSKIESAHTDKSYLCVQNSADNNLNASAYPSKIRRANIYTLIPVKPSANSIDKCNGIIINNCAEAAASFADAPANERKRKAKASSANAVEFMRGNSEYATTLFSPSNLDFTEAAPNRITAPQQDIFGLFRLFQSPLIESCIGEQNAPEIAENALLTAVWTMRQSTKPKLDSKQSTDKTLDTDLVTSVCAKDKRSLKWNACAMHKDDKKAELCKILKNQRILLIGSKNILPVAERLSRYTDCCFISDDELAAYRLHTKGVFRADKADIALSKYVFVVDAPEPNEFLKLIEQLKNNAMLFNLTDVKPPCKGVRFKSDLYSFARRNRTRVLFADNLRPLLNSIDYLDRECADAVLSAVVESLHGLHSQPDSVELSRLKEQMLMALYTARE